MSVFIRSSQKKGKLDAARTCRTHSKDSIEPRRKRFKFSNQCTLCSQTTICTHFKSNVHILNLLHMYNVQVHGSSISGNQCFVCFFSILICFVLLYDVTLCRRAAASGRDLPGLPDMSRCQNNVCNKNQKLKSYHNAVLHGRERERERACRVQGPARPPSVPAAGPRPCPPGPSTAAPPGTAAPPIPRQTHTQQPQSRAQTCLPFRPGPRLQMSAHWRQILPRMASTAIADAICSLP